MYGHFKIYKPVGENVESYCFTNQLSYHLFTKGNRDNFEPSETYKNTVFHNPTVKRLI